MYPRVCSKIINTDNLVDADVYEPGEELTPCDEGRAVTRTVVITMTALEADQDGTLGPRKIVLEGEDADLFLEALPVYSPVLEEWRAALAPMSPRNPESPRYRHAVA